jgi:hypothetical protein
MRRVVLIGVGSGDKVEGSSHGATWPHLGILTVGSAIADLGGEVILYDENIEGPIPSGVISSEDIVGLSVVAPSVDRGLYLASQIKKCGATVFMGNDGAASRAYQILSRYPEVDGVFLGDDLAAVKKVFSSITRNEYLPKNEVSGFAQRKQSGGIMVSPSLVFMICLISQYQNFHFFLKSIGRKFGIIIDELMGLNTQSQGRRA